MAKQNRLYGTWPSPISPRLLAGIQKLYDVQWDSASDTLVWLEGSAMLAQSGSDAPRILTDSDLPVRARVGYGGGDFTVAHGWVYFAGPEGRLYRQALSGGKARPILPAFGSAASPRVSPDGKWLVYVHSYERVDGLALTDAEGQLWPRKLAFGTDFVMQPAWHPAGTHLAYIAWNHPLMPWDGAELRLATLHESGGSPCAASVETIAGDSATAIFQPEFSPDGRHLAYVSDKTGWNQLYLYDLEEKSHTMLTVGEAEHGRPAWNQGMRVHGWTHDGRALYYLRNDQGVYSLWRYDVQGGASQRIEALDHYTSMSQPAVSPRREALALIASASKIPPRIISYEPEGIDVPQRLSLPDTPTISITVEEGVGERIHQRSSSENLLPEQISEAQTISWTGHDGETVYGIYYPPASDACEGVGAPPLIVEVHGGPTSQRGAAYDGEAQFFATRGFAVLQVNHRGSTGYGKAYMNKLRGNWGYYDVEDSASGAAYLASHGLADPNKFVIQGGSAGGYTVLQSLVDKPGFYRAAVCLYGISNQFLLVQETHKFEERYSDSLLGPLPEAADLYRARSPIFHAHKIVDPLIVFQGADDEVVPRNQSDLIVESLRARGVPHEYHVYEGEGHGFRKPETLEHYYNATVKFLLRHVVYA